MHSPSRVLVCLFMWLSESAEVKYSDPFQGFMSGQGGASKRHCTYGHAAPTPGSTQATSSEKQGSDRVKASHCPPWPEGSTSRCNLDSHTGLPLRGKGQHVPEPEGPTQPMSKGSQDLAHFGSVRFQLLPCHPSHRKGEKRGTAAMSFLSLSQPTLQA